MSRDKEGGPARRPRVLARARVGWPRPLRELKDLVYEVYLAAGTPSLDEIAEAIREGDLVGAPSRDTIRRCISDPSPPPSLPDIVSIASVLARFARWDEQDLCAQVRGLWVKARMATGVGRPVGEFEDDLVLTDLGVHPALDVDGARGRLGVLPAYVPRRFDRQVQSVVEAAAAGRSGLVVLVGDSSTGKTRALWEAVRSLPTPWRLWHPIAPTRPDAVLAELADVAPHTVIWLNEAQFYLAPEPLGERVAAGLRELLRDPARGPVLVMTTLWPGHWQTLTTRTAQDRHTQARELLGGHRIDVPETFTPDDLVTLAGTAGTDPRLREAADRAQDRQVAQYLAGVLALMDCYHAARGVARALVHAAMDARRLGASPHIPLAWLVGAARGYLTETEWNATDRGGDWHAQALDYVTQDCTGIPGILTRVETTTPRNQRKRRPAGGVEPAAERHARGTCGPQYQLADYLDQYGRRHRADQIPPIDFWTTAASHAHPADLYALGLAAQARGLYRDAAQLHKHSTTHGSAYAASQLIHHLHALHPKDPRPAEWASTHAALDAPDGVSSLLNALRHAWAEEQLGTLLARDPAAHIPLDSLAAVADLLEALQEVGAGEQLVALALRAAANVPLDNPVTVAKLLEALQETGMDKGLGVLLDRDPAAHVALVTPHGVSRLLYALMRANAAGQFITVLERDPATHVVLDDLYMVGWLLDTLRKAGAGEQFDALASRAAAHVALDNPAAVAHLLDTLQEAGASEQLGVLKSRAAAHVILDNPAAATLPDALQEDELGKVEGLGHFPFGREPDGSAAAWWTWEDLE
ncbi:hypothetical protein [Streptomyces clavifer]|uniref:hypothetical protein n=1 Tax=Streptomyces clavifer TaxID=68188 RepID=UPI0033E82975